VKRILTEQQQNFISIYTATGNASQAAKMAGYKQPKQKGYDLKNRFAPEIAEAIRGEIGDDVVPVIRQVRELALNAESEAVKLNACKDLLDRAGYKPVDRSRVDSVTTTVHELSTEELEQELEKLLSKDMPVH
jgi:hypothetical protein